MMVALLFSIDGLSWDTPTDHVELFAGKMSVTRGEWAEGRTAVPFEINLDANNMDILSSSGFANAVFQICNLKPGSGCLAAPVCSSWVFMSRGTTLRTKARPLGRSDNEGVINGNIMTARVLILMLLASAKGIFWLLEQPESSLMEHHPCFQEVLAMVKLVKKTIYMQNYGGSSPKPTILYSRLSPDLGFPFPYLRTVSISFCWIVFLFCVLNQNSPKPDF